MTISSKLGFILQSDRYSREMAGQSLERYTLLREGEFAYNRGNSITSPQGCIFRLERSSAVVPFVYYCFSTRPELSTDFAAHAFRQGVLNRELARRINSGVRDDGLLNISAADFFGCELALPPLPEQRAIASALDEFESAVTQAENLVAALERSRIEITRNFQGTEQTTNWQIRPIGSLLRLCQYGLSIPLDGDGTVPVIRMPDIDAGRVNVDPAKLKSTDVSAQEIAACSISEGDLLFNRTNSQALVGKTGIVRTRPAQPIVFASYLIRMITREDVNPFWLNAVMNLPRIQDRLKTLATPGVSQWNINAKTLKRFMIPVPPKKDQDRLANTFEETEARLEAEKNDLATRTNCHSALAQELLSGRLRLPESIIARYREIPEAA